MPELPEVETVRRVLEPQLAGRVIEGVDVLNGQVVAHPAPEAFASVLVGRKIAGMGRRGKYLAVALDDGSELVVHLRMTGQLLVAPPDAPVEKYTHLVLRLSDGAELRYLDTRRFGRFWLFAPGEPDEVSGRCKLGPEPDDAVLTVAYLKAQAGRKRKPIKELLHDQSVVAGIGNIYSDEILFDARVNPLKPCCTLDDEEWERLARSIPRIIAWGIEEDVMTPEEYLRGQGKEYRNAEHLRAYGREGEPCSRCGAPLQRTKVGSRSSYFCPECQKLTGV